jgi:hypothetical protein
MSSTLQRKEKKSLKDIKLNLISECTMVRKTLSKLLILQADHFESNNDL